METNSKNRKYIRKAGRTLLVKSSNDNKVEPNDLNSYLGLTIIKENKSDGFFLTFNTLENALNAYRDIKKKYKVKFSYYKLFFTINGLDEKSDYNKIKTLLTNYVSENTDSKVLYCKLYRKNDKYMGCGDLTVDTQEGMMQLLLKSNNLKEFNLDGYNGIFYRFNTKKE